MGPTAAVLGRRTQGFSRQEAETLVRLSIRYERGEFRELPHDPKRVLFIRCLDEEGQALRPGLCLIGKRMAASRRTLRMNGKRVKAGGSHIRTKRRKVAVRAGSELARCLEHAARSSDTLLLDAGEAVYPVYVGPRDSGEQATGAVPSSEEAARSREGILKAAGSWKHIDVEAFKAYVAKRRRSAGRRPVRL